MKAALEGAAVEDVSGVESFELFVRCHQSTVRALVVALYGGRDPDDIIQETFLRAQKAWPSLTGHDRPELWVRRVAMNLAVSRLRRWRSETKALVRLAGRREFNVVVLSDESAAVWAEVRLLPSRQAQVIALRYLEDLSVSEIAGTLGIAEGTVRSTLHQARVTLGHRLTPGVEVPVEENLR